MHTITDLLNKGSYDDSIEAKKTALKLNYQIQQDQLQRAASKFKNNLTIITGINGFDMTSPYMQNHLKEGQKVISSTKLYENERFNNQLAALDDEDDAWWGKLFTDNISDAIELYKG